MARLKTTAASGPSKRAKPMVDEAGPSAKKAKKGKKVVTAAEKQSIWEKKMENLDVFRCERQVVKSHEETHALISAIQRHGLDFFFGEVLGYKEKLVRAFYMYMKVDKEHEKITSRVGGKLVVVTPDSIAQYLGYARPDAGSCTYPSEVGQVEERPFSRMLEEITVSGETAWDSVEENLIPGKLKELYRLANKFLYYDVAPFGNEKRPSAKDAELLYIFGSEDERLDWAQYVWDQLRFFREKETAPRVFVLSAMITAFCEAAGCKSPSDPLVVGNPGPITLGSIRKSQSLSVRPGTSTPGSSRTTPRRRAVEQRVEDPEDPEVRITRRMWKTQSLHLRRVDRKQTALDQRQDRMERRQLRMMGEMRCLITFLTGGPDAVYTGDIQRLEASEPESESEESDDEQGTGSDSGGEEDEQAEADQQSGGDGGDEAAEE